MEFEPQEKKQRNGYWSGLLSGLLLALLLAGALYIGRQVFDIFTARQIAGSSENKTELIDVYTTSKIEVIEDTIEEHYLEDAELTQLEDGLYSGLVDALGDPYSVYYSAEELTELQMQTEGIYYGIGAYISQTAGDPFCIISGVIENTPAEAADLRAGDIIYMVDGVLTEGMESTEVVSMIKGEEGTTVLLTLVREGEDDYVEIEVERKKIESPTVTSEMLENNIAYIQITEFDEVTTDQFAEALAECKGNGMEGLILDLRSNPGGSMNAVIEIARMVLPKGLIVYTEDKYGERDEYSSDGSRQLTVPAVVLVNGYSASASEILAGAMKDHEAATIMGTTTFGKGIVQRIIALSDGSAVKLTVSKYYTPNGNDIHEKGIEPDVEVIFDAEAYYDEGVDNQLQEAINYLSKQ